MKIARIPQSIATIISLLAIVTVILFLSIFFLPNAVVRGQAITSNNLFPQTQRRTRPTPGKQQPTKTPEQNKGNLETKTETAQENIEFLFWLLNKQARKSTTFTHDQDRFDCHLNDKSQIEISIDRDTTQTDPEGGIFETKYTINSSDQRVLFTWYYKSKQRVSMKLTIEEGMKYGVTRGGSINDALMKKYPGLNTRNGPIPASEIPPGCLSLGQAVKQITDQYQDSRSQYKQEKMQYAENNRKMTAAERLLVLTQDKRKEYVNFVLPMIRRAFSAPEPDRTLEDIARNRALRAKKEEGLTFAYGNMSFNLNDKNYLYNDIQLYITVTWIIQSGPGTGSYSSSFRISSDGKLEASSYRYNGHVENPAGIVRPSFALKNPGDYISPDAAITICATYFGYKPGVTLAEQPAILEIKSLAKHAAEEKVRAEENARKKAEQRLNNRVQNVDFIRYVLATKFPVSETDLRNANLYTKIEFDIEDNHYQVAYLTNYMGRAYGFKVFVTPNSSGGAKGDFEFRLDGTLLTEVTRWNQEAIDAIGFEPAKMGNVGALKGNWERYNNRKSDTGSLRPNQPASHEKENLNPRQQNVDLFFYILKEKVPEKGPGVVEKQSGGAVSINIGRIAVKKPPSSFEFTIKSNKYKLTRKDRGAMEVLITGSDGSTRKYMYTSDQTFQKAEFKANGQNITLDSESELISRGLDKEEMEFDAQQFVDSKELRDIWERYRKGKGVK